LIDIGTGVLTHHGRGPCEASTVLESGRDWYTPLNATVLNWDALR